MQAISISFFRFQGLAQQLWAFSQMGFARFPLRRIEDIGFAKQFGTGSKESFRPLPNPRVYAILAVWPSLDIAKARIANERVFKSYRNHSIENYTVYLNAASSRGEWDGAPPFRVETEGTPTPIAVLTRATVRARSLIRFWRAAPSISAMTSEEPELHFKMGMGEVPWLHQVTFSIWTNAQAMTEFAYRNGFHSEAVKAKRQEDWFKEELFVRFQVLAGEGSWEGKNPLEALTFAQAA